MNILKKLLYRNLPKNFLYSYGKYIQKQKHLHNGWQVVFLYNGMVFLFHKHYSPLSIPACKKITEAMDGKFMIKDKHKNVVVYSPEGMQLTPFSKKSVLYPNGWFQGAAEDETLSLFNNDGECVGSKLRYAKVYKNGMYHMSVLPKKGNPHHAGIFNAKGERLYFTNVTSVHILPNGWFVLNNMLFNNLGHLFIHPIPERKVPNWLLCVVGFLMKPKNV